MFYQDADPLGAILLTNYTITKAPEVNRKHTFKAVKYGQRTYMFQAESEADMNRWANAMSCAATANTKVISNEYIEPCIMRPTISTTIPFFQTYYRPQRSWGKVIFSQASVILFTGRVCLSACWDTTPRTGTPGDQAGTPLGPGRHPSGTRQAPPDQASPRPSTPPKDQSGTPPTRQVPPPPSRAYWEIRSTSGRYASYWNALLFTGILVWHFSTISSFTALRK